MGGLSLVLLHISPYIFLKTVTIPTYHSISIAVPRYIAMQLPSYITWLVVIHHCYILLCMILYSWCVVYPCYARSLHILLHWQMHTVLYIMFCSLRVICTKSCNHIRVLPLLEKSHGGHRKEKQKKKKKKKKRIKKRGATLLSFIKVVLMFSTCSIHSHHLCSCLAPILHVREFSCSTSITMWGIYTIELELYIPMMSFLKSALGLREQPSWMHPH